MYLIVGMTIALSAIYLSVVTEHRWLIWVYRIIGPISMTIFLLLILMAFEVLNERFPVKKA